MTQDAPEAALMLLSYFEAIVHGDSHVDAARAALSRRVPASGGELKGIAWSDLDYLMSIIDSAIEDGFDPDEDGPLLDQIRAELKAPTAASPIVAAPEGLSYGRIIEIVNDCTERMKRGGESHRMLARWISEDIHAALAAAPSIPEGKAEPAGQHDALPEYDPTSPLSVAEHIYAQCEQTVLSLNGLPEHSRDALISVFGHFKKLELAALSTPPGAP